MPWFTMVQSRYYLGKFVSLDYYYVTVSITLFSWVRSIIIKIHSELKLGIGKFK